MKLYCSLLAAFVLVAAGESFAAAPDQVGTWVGSLKTKVRTTSGTRSVKSVMQLEIAADDTTTVTLDGVLQLGSSGDYIPGEAFFVYVDISGAPNIKQTFAVAHFKGTKVKGATSGITIGTGLVETFDGKFNLKKQP